MIALVVTALLAHATTNAQPWLQITDAHDVIALENAGLTLAAVAFDAPSAKSNAELAKVPAYSDVVKAVDDDLRAMKAADSRMGVGMRFSHRAFDAAWLTSTDTRWELAGVVNRIDRKPFDPHTCGEVRLVYRLAYTTQPKNASTPFSARMPATMNVVFYLPDDDASCRAIAAGFVKAPLDEVLSKARLSSSKLKSVEIDLQAVRWPSTVRPDLGGHAEYILRVFHRDGAHLVAAPLENTPDVARITRDSALKKELVAFLSAHVDDIDKGIVVVPDKFLVDKAVSVTPHGLARAQNRPWSKLFAPNDLASLQLPASPSSSISNPNALLRRLDGLSCVGCHQSRSLAGFHMLGEDRADETAAGALAVSTSPHFDEDQARRRAYVDALIAGKAVDDTRRPPDHEIDRGSFGDACGLRKDFAPWTCATGFECVAVDDNEVGECMPKASAAGSACRVGVVDAARDRIKTARDVACASDAVCEGVDVGFPGGMCASTCESPGEHGACGAIAQLTPFNDCLAKGGLFSTCAKLATPAGLRACGANDPCRPDYLCARNADGRGVCLPPYFVLQMRVDGHPLH